MPFQNLNLKDLRVKALSMVGDVNSDSRFGPGPTTATGNLADGFINDALLRITTDWLGLDDFWTTTTIVGKRDYPLPGGFRLVQAAWYQGSELTEARAVDMNFFTPGNSFPCLYFIQKSQRKILLGPDPPYMAVPLTMRYWRAPQMLVEDGDIPEIPNEYRPALSYFAAGQMLLGDESLAAYKEIMAQYGKLEETFREWIQAGSTNNPTVRNVTEGWGPYGNGGWGWGGP